MTQGLNVDLRIRDIGSRIEGDALRARRQGGAIGPETDKFLPCRLVVAADDIEPVANPRKGLEIGVFVLRIPEISVRPPLPGSECCLGRWYSVQRNAVDRSWRAVKRLSDCLERRIF